MKTAATEEPTTKDDYVDHVLYLKLEQITESKTNPRRTVKDRFFADLVQSVQEHGVIQPILVRRIDHAPGIGVSHEIVAGHRRFAAAIEAGATHIPALVKDLSAEQALEIQMIENLQRADLHPLEEAEGYRQLMQTHHYDVARIAERIGRSVKYVYDRVKLLSLTKEAQKLFLDGRYTAGHAVILARLKPEDQARALELGRVAEYAGFGGPLFVSESTLFTKEEEIAAERAAEQDPLALMKPRSVRELQAWVDAHVRFDTGAEDLPDLFPETYQVVAKAVEEAEKIVQITHEYMIPNDAREGGKVLTERSWRRADGSDGAKTCEHSLTGVIVIGAGRGQAFKVCTAKEKCKTHWADWQKERTQRQKHAAKSGATGEEREASESERSKKGQERRAAEQKQRRAAAPLILKAAAEKIAKAPAGARGQLADILISIMQGMMHGSHRLSEAVPRGKTAEDLVRHLVFNALYDVAEYDWAWDGFAKRARAVGVDVAKILKQAAPAQTSATPDVQKAGKPKRGVCRVCGCTEENACLDKKNGTTCAWVDRGKTLCSKCEATAKPAKKRKTGKR